MIELLLPCCSGEYREKNMKTAQNLVTCLYEAKLGRARLLAGITWCKTRVSQALSVHVTDRGYSCEAGTKPWCFWKKQGHKTLKARGRRVELFWDLNAALYDGGAEPHEKFYVALVSEGKMVLLVGDMKEEASRRTGAETPLTEAVMVSRREHLFGKRYYTTTAQFGDSRHEIVIECHAGEHKEPRLEVKVDKRVVLQVKHLTWKFRGNEIVLIDGVAIEVLWDVYNWLWNPTARHAVFMFQTCPSDDDGDHYHSHHHRGLGSWPSWSSSTEIEKKLLKSRSSSCSNCSSVMQWASNGNLGESAMRSSTDCGFSLLLYAWKRE